MQSSGSDLRAKGAWPASEAASSLGVEDAKRAVGLAIRASSIHNTQPWSWTFHDGCLSLWADRSRQLTVADPDGHSLLISCGATLALAELALRAAGWKLEVDRLPDASDPNLLAQLTGIERSEPSAPDVARMNAAQRRRSERRPFGPGRPTEQHIEQIRNATDVPSVFAHFVTHRDEARNLAVVVSQADRFERNDPAYLAEMARWVHADEQHVDGVPATAIPRVAPQDPRHTDVPLRDFEVGIPGAQLIPAGVDEQPLLAIVFTTADAVIDQLQAGEAMMRLMIEAETSAISTCPLSQAIDMLAFRRRMRLLMGWAEYPQMMLRLGTPPSGELPTLTPRRPVADVLQVCP